MSEFEVFLESRLADAEAAGLGRALRSIESPQGAEVTSQGRRMVNFSSNDYLGLAAHPRLAAASALAGEISGLGAGASRLISGTHPCHEKLEEDLARFKNTEAALTFSSGYAAALGVVPSIVGKKDVLILDKLCHASLIDAAKLSGALLRIFPHNHLEKLKDHLRWARQKFPQARILIMVESVYSMDGDLAPLREIAQLKDEFGAWLFLDEAHAMGVLGSHGRGLADEVGLGERIEIQMGTLGKALGAAGAYVCGSRLLRNFLINNARSFIFSTAPPPGIAAAASAAITLLESPEGAERVGRLRAVRSELGSLLNEPGAPSAIFPILLGSEARALTISSQLREEGFFVPAIRFPTVARSAARLRATVTSEHTSEQLEKFAVRLRLLLKEV